MMLEKIIKVVGSLMIPLIGPKWTMISMGVPAVAGWICLVVGKPLDDTLDPLALFYVGRILTGFGGGAFALVAPLYVSEIAEVKIRGALGSLMQFQVTMGIFFVNVLSINNAIYWDIITGICIAFPGKYMPRSILILHLFHFNYKTAA